jgi:hypothetical protein
MVTNDLQQRILEGEREFDHANYEKALQIAEEVLFHDSLNVEALNNAGMACAALGDLASAARYYEHALHINPASELPFFNLLSLLIHAEDVELVAEAFQLYEGGIPDSPEKQQYRDALFAGGDSAAGDVQIAPVIPVSRSPYDQILSSIHAELQPATFVEIGMAGGDALMRDGQAAAIEINPEIDVEEPSSPHVKLFKKTGDAFFREHSLRQELDGRPVDLALMGLRLFEQALRNFIRLEKCCTPSSVILVQGCYPAGADTTGRERKDTPLWSGDVWKLIVCLKKYRPELTIHTIDVPPSGLGLITGLNPESDVLSQNMEAIYKEFILMPFDSIAGGKVNALNRIDGHPEAIREVLLSVLNPA